MSNLDLLWAMQREKVKVFDWREKIQNPTTENNLSMIKSISTLNPNIVKLIGAKIHEPEFRLRRDNHEIRLLSNMSYVVVEYLSGSTLKSFLSKNQENKLALKIVIQLALHLARGLAYLRSWKLIHGNVKPENMLLDRNFNLKKIEFGTPNMEISSHEEVTSDSATEAVSYMAPECRVTDPSQRPDMEEVVWMLEATAIDTSKGICSFYQQAYKFQSYCSKA
ncbi:hypothetical protein CRYUN_Cryun21dG0069800 [Craigia yunnanensis]